MLRKQSELDLSRNIEFISQPAFRLEFLCPRAPLRLYGSRYGIEAYESERVSIDIFEASEYLSPDRGGHIL